MKAFLRMPLAAVLMFLALGCKEKAALEMDDRVVALVNGEVISKTDFEAELARELGFADGINPQRPEQVEPVKRALLNTLIERTLLLQAAKQGGITAPAAEVERRMLRMRADFPAEGFNQALANGQLSMAELKQKTEALIITEKLFAQAVYPRVAVTEEEIRRHFEEHADEYKEPQRVRAAQIVVKTLDEAKRVQKELRGGKKFPDLARRYSLSADAKVGGDLGYFERGVMPAAFDEAAFALAVGEVSEIVETDYGFHLFKVLDKKEPRRKELMEVRSTIETRLLEKKRADAQAAYVKSLQEKAELRVNESLLQTLSGRSTSSPSKGT
jgi:peptidyl-prolyl cis-trans isomerase C